MGGCCCCCLPRRTENPINAEERVPLHNQRISSVLSTELKETDGETLTRDLPSAIPFGFSHRHFHTPPRSLEIQSNISNGAHGTADSDEETQPAMRKLEMELSKTIDPFFQESIEEDFCPICLEEYEAENPKMFTKCDHNFHLACILEWMERSDACPICDKEAVLFES